MQPVSDISIDKTADMMAKSPLSEADIRALVQVNAKIRALAKKYRMYVLITGILLPLFLVSPLLSWSALGSTMLMACLLYAASVYVIGNIVRRNVHSSVKIDNHELIDPMDDRLFSLSNKNLAIVASSPLSQRYAINLKNSGRQQRYFDEKVIYLLDDIAFEKEMTAYAEFEKMSH